ncbi:MAG TPA: hypothetical protein VF970_17135 [Gemmatimonadales bacterium]
MSAAPQVLEERGLGATDRRDAWWLSPAAVAVGLLAFGVYSTWAAWVGGHYEWGPYLSPFYSPTFLPAWWPLSPAFLILWAPLGFRATCYYYRKAYYRAFFLDPVACAVGEPRHTYQGEQKLFLFQNLHRFFMYVAVVFIFILGYDALISFSWPVNGVLADGTPAAGPREFGIGVGTLVLTANVVLLAGFTFGCHALRHAVGGGTDCWSCVRFGRQRHALWRGVSALNQRHMLWAWVSLVWVGLADGYVRLVAMGIITDVRLF